MEGVIGEPVTLTAGVCASVARAFATWLRGQSDCRAINGAEQGRHLRVAVGHDCRLTSPELAQALANATREAGCDVMMCGVCSTPAMLASTVMDEVAADGALMVTGSHLPFNRNGLKLFAHGHEVDADELTVILSHTSDPAAPAPQPGVEHVCNMLSHYSSRLRRLAEQQGPSAGEGEGERRGPLSGLRVVVDAANGVGGFFVSRVLRPLGCDTTGSQCLIPDGRFPNHPANPEDYEALRALSQRVVEVGADMGILFDSDCDRVGFVGNHGRSITRNEFVAMASRLALEEHPGSTVVTDSITSTGLTEFIEGALGGHHRRYQRGYRKVIGEAERLNRAGGSCWLAAETSGHAAFRENGFADDGAWFAVKVLLRLCRLKGEGRELYSLVEDLPHPASHGEWRLALTGSDYSSAADAVMRGLAQFVSQMAAWTLDRDNEEGLRVECHDDNEKGWFLLRLSLHSSELVLNAESELSTGVADILATLKRYLLTCRELDLSSLY